MGLLDLLFGGGDTSAQPGVLNAPQPISPTTLGLLGAAANYGPALQYSRLPQNATAGLLAAAGGYGQGYQGGIAAQNEAALKAAQARGLNANAGLDELALRGYTRMQDALGGNAATTGGAIGSSFTGPSGVSTAGLPNAGNPNGIAQSGASPGQFGGLLHDVPPPSTQPDLSGRGANEVSPDAAFAAQRGAQPPATAPTSSAPPPLFNVADLKTQYQLASANPKMAPIAAQLLSLMEKGTPEGSYIAVDGSIQARPGYNHFVQTKSAADAAGAAPYKALEALMSRAGNPVRLEPGDSVTTGFQTLPPAIQNSFAALLGGTVPGTAPNTTGGLVAGGAPVPTQGAPAHARGVPLTSGGGSGGVGINSTGFPVQSIYGQQGTLQAPLTLEGKTLQGTVLPKQYEAAADGYKSAQAVSGQLDMMDRAIDQLNQSGWSSTGAGANLKLGAIKGFNSLEQTFGMAPSFDPNKIATWEDFTKESTRMGFELAKTLGSREAMLIVQQATAAVPNAENTYMGARLVSSSLRQAAQRQQDFYQYLQDFASKHGGSTFGADTAFNRANPVGTYTKTAVANAIPDGATAMLKNNPDLAMQFDAKYGRGMSAFVLGRTQ